MVDTHIYFTSIISFYLISGLIILQPDFGMTFLICYNIFLSIIYCRIFQHYLVIFSIIRSYYFLCLSILLFFLSMFKKEWILFISPISGILIKLDLKFKGFSISGGLLGKGPGQGVSKR